MVAELCARRVIQSGLVLRGVDVLWATKYVALNLPEQEVRRRQLTHLIPKKAARTGRKPSILTVTRDEQIERWRYAKMPSTYSKEEVDKVLEGLIEIMISHMFNCHI